MWAWKIQRYRAWPLLDTVEWTLDPWPMSNRESLDLDFEAGQRSSGSLKSRSSVPWRVVWTCSNRKAMSFWCTLRSSADGRNSPKTSERNRCGNNLACLSHMAFQKRAWDLGIGVSVRWNPENWCKSNAMGLSSPSYHHCYGCNHPHGGWQPGFPILFVEFFQGLGNVLFFFRDIQNHQTSDWKARSLRLHMFASCIASCRILFRLWIGEYLLGQSWKSWRSRKCIIWCTQTWPQGAPRYII